MAHASSPLPMSQLLAACARELTDLTQTCEALQDALSSGFGQAAIQDAQALDLVTQSLAALSQYLGAIGAAAPPDWILDATAVAQALPLAGLGARLIGAQPPSEAEGELFLFESAP
ncbi:MAG: hypothetical protein JWO33_1497 [Caulobacteraceae bacterium]|nr:hypothetical protein [Caulobacteraceae bacterium]